MKDILKAKAAELGFPCFGVTDFSYICEYDNAVLRLRETGLPVESPVFRDRDLEAQGYKSLIVLGAPHTPFAKQEADRLNIASHYTAKQSANTKAEALLAFLSEAGIKAKIAEVPLKLAAYRAGIGDFGRNSLLYHKTYGSFIVLYAVAVDLELAQDSPPGPLCGCGDCMLCIKTCPTGALVPQGGVDASKCLRNFMARNTSIPVDMREKFECGSLMGCELCQRVCPRNAAVYQAAPPPSAGALSARHLLSAWRSGTTEDMAVLGALMGYNYARPGIALTMALLYAGSSGDSSYLPLCADALAFPKAQVRGMTAWAIGKLDGTGYIKDLQMALTKETDPLTVEEINEAIDVLAQ